MYEVGRHLTICLFPRAKILSIQEKSDFLRKFYTKLIENLTSCHILFIYFPNNERKVWGRFEVGSGNINFFSLPKTALLSANALLERRLKRGFPHQKCMRLRHCDRQSLVLNAQQNLRRDQDVGYGRYASENNYSYLFYRLKCNRSATY